MATIQVREIPEDAYDAIVRKAKANGQSIQQYARQFMIDFAFAPTEADFRLAVETNKRKFVPGITTADILDAIDEGRR